MIARIHLLTASTLLWGSLFSVGMGMEMSVSNGQMDAKSSHSCCPGQASENEEKSGLACCLYVPGAAIAKAQLPHCCDFSRYNAPRVLITKTITIERVHPSRAPPDHSPPERLTPSLRAPPTV